MSSILKKLNNGPTEEYTVVTVRVSKSLMKDVTSARKKKGHTVSDIVRAGLDMYVTEAKGAKAPRKRA